MSDRFLKVKEHPGMYRDPATNAIIIDDPNARSAYLAQRNTVQKSLSTTQGLREEINIMKEELSCMRTMLQDIISHVKNN